VSSRKNLSNAPCFYLGFFILFKRVSAEVRSINDG
jgi:hypothetical protein